MILKCWWMFFLSCTFLSIIHKQWSWNYWFFSWNRYRKAYCLSCFTQSCQCYLLSAFEFSKSMLICTQLIFCFFIMFSRHLVLSSFCIHNLSWPSILAFVLAFYILVLNCSRHTLEVAFFLYLFLRIDLIKQKNPTNYT